MLLTKCSIKMCVHDLDLDFMLSYRHAASTGTGVTVYLGSLARAGLAHNYDHLVLPDHLQQLIAAVKDRQEAALLLQSPALGPVTDCLPKQA